MNTITRFAAAVLFGAGFATAASAQDFTGPRVVGSGENASVVYAQPSQNIVGGALTRTVGSGESARTEVLSVQATQAGRFATVVGSGENMSVVYFDHAPTTLSQAQAATRG